MKLCVSWEFAFVKVCITAYQSLQSKNCFACSQVQINGAVLYLKVNPRGLKLSVFQLFIWHEHQL